MYENVKLIIEEAISRKTGKNYTRVKAVFENGEEVIIGFKDLAMKIVYTAEK